jgi:protoheme IX farnesyltransferase
LIRNYYQLAKPGIVYGNLVTASAGFLLASKGSIDFWLLFATLFGISLVIASASVFNNYIDRRIDSKMARTKKRALAIKSISVRNALAFASSLGIIGFSVLLAYTNLLTVILGLIAYVNYIVFYAIVKRRSEYGTIVGSISGAIPITAGYTAAANSFDSGALLLFLILTFWQMPHFYTIAMYRLNDYKSAEIPVLPLKRSVQNTKNQIIFYILAFIYASILLNLLGYTGYSYLAVVILAGLFWLRKALSGLTTKNDTLWARQMFFSSLIVLGIFSLMISLDSFLP